MAGNKDVGVATGFLVSHKGRQYLITNGHVLTGRHPASNALVLSAEPDTVVIRHHGLALGTSSAQSEALYENGVKRWLQHPLGLSVDVVALPLANLPASSVRPYPLEYLTLAEVDLEVRPAMAVSVVGFPLGFSAAEGFAIWKTGHVASDPDFDYDNRPAFLIDATTRGGMSGSPVYARVYGPRLGRTGSQAFVDGGVSTRFLGVYSGRLPNDSEIGIVWKPRVITEILQAAP